MEENNVKVLSEVELFYDMLGDTTITELNLLKETSGIDQLSELTKWINNRILHAVDTKGAIKLRAISAGIPLAALDIEHAYRLTKDNYKKIGDFIYYLK